MVDPNPSFSGAQINFESNQAGSDYNALQARYTATWRDLNLIASYAWSHSIDDPGILLISTTTIGGQERASSDFDVRHSFLSGITYAIPESTHWSALLRHWELDSIVRARSAEPVNVTYGRFIGTVLTDVRPDVVRGVPLHIVDDSAPHGIRINPVAFSIPVEERQGNFGRNALRGFAVDQVDLGVARRFFLSEKLQLDWKAELFNVFNHPNFGAPFGSLGGYEEPPDFQPDSLFGAPLAMANSVANTSNTLNPLYRSGGPRSIQLSLRLNF